MFNDVALCPSCAGGYDGGIQVPSLYPSSLSPGLARSPKECGGRWAVWYDCAMTAQILVDMVKRAEAWPVEVQEELAEIAREIDAALQGGLYQATPEELAGIDRGLEDARAGRFATTEQVAAVFAKYRPA